MGRSAALGLFAAVCLFWAFWPENKKETEVRRPTPLETARPGDFGTEALPPAVHTSTRFEPPPQAYHAISGRVVNTRGQPVHAYIRYAGRSQKCDSFGRFLLLRVPPSGLMEVTAPGYLRHTVPFAQLPVGTFFWVAQLQRAPGVQGTVVGSDGRPVSDALIRLNRAGQRVASAVTDWHGQYRIDYDEPLAGLTVTAHHESYGHAEEPVESPDVDLVLPSGGWLRVRFFDKQGALIPRKWVRITEPFSAVPHRLREESDDVWLGPFAAGPVVFYAFADGFVPRPVSAVVVDSEETPVQVTMERAITLTGRVRSAAGGFALEGAVVSFGIRGETTYPVSTGCGPDGEFELAMLPKDRVNIHVSALGFKTRVFPMDLSDATETAHLDAVLNPGDESKEPVLIDELGIVARRVPQGVQVEEIHPGPSQGQLDVGDVIIAVSTLRDGQLEFMEANDVSSDEFFGALQEPQPNTEMIILPGGQNTREYVRIGR